MMDGKSIDNPNRKAGYKGSIHIYEFTGKGDDNSAWYELDTLKEKLIINN